MIVYLAGPIDFNKDSAVNDHRHEVKKYFTKYASAWVYDPSKAWDGGPEPDQFVHWANLKVIEQSDLMVAVLVRSVLTVGTILEIQYARELDIPVIVVGDVGDASISLAALEVEVLSNIAEIDDEWVADLALESEFANAIIERRKCECLALHAADANCDCTY